MRLKELPVKGKSLPLPSLSVPVQRSRSSRGVENSRRRSHHRPSWRLGGSPRQRFTPHPVRRSPPKHSQLGAARCASVNPRLVWRYALRHATVYVACFLNRGPPIVHRDYTHAGRGRNTRQSFPRYTTGVTDSTGIQSRCSRTGRRRRESKSGNRRKLYPQA